ncbi:MAG: NAD(P)/FAD-dependent oxidoreductase [Oscillospiraceae bacterium]|nr:NAD(P)/FAD-dependent oxidoreductase [Oscillospiraceae bacterium]
MEYDVVVIGGGAAGMLAAGTSAENGYRTALLEKNTRLGRKLLITGKGRCNICNHCDVNTVIENVPTNPRFLYGAVSKFPPEEVINFFTAHGLAVKTERGNRVFPQSDRAKDVVDALARYVHQSGAKILHGTAERLLLEDKKVCGVETEAGDRILAENIIICCGGVSYPGTGSTGDGYRLAQQAGHTIVPPRPSLVPLIAYGTDCGAMQGLSLRNIAIRVVDAQKQSVIYDDFGELLFTHFGLSGPVILSASSHMQSMAPRKYEVHIDLKPALSEEQLDLRLQRDFEKNHNKDFINALGELLPRKMIPVMVKRSQIPPERKCNQITREERHRFLTLLKNFPVLIKGFRPVEEAIVTSGGVCVKEVSPKTMGSKLVSGLYFAGEVLDVDAYTGGFNLQIAFSTGKLAGNSVYQY